MPKPVGGRARKHKEPGHGENVIAYASTTHWRRPRRLRATDSTAAETLTSLRARHHKDRREAADRPRIQVATRTRFRVWGRSCADAGRSLRMPRRKGEPLPSPGSAA